MKQFRFLGCAILLAFLQGAAAQCSQGVDLVVVLDRSGSIDSDEWIQERTFAVNLTIGFESAFSLPNKYGAVTFSAGAEEQLALTLDYELALTTIGNIPKGNGATNIVQGLTIANRTLKAGARSGFANLIVLVSDGEPTTGGGEAECRALANHLKDQGVRIVTIGVGGGANLASLMTDMASSPEYYFHVDNTAGLIDEINTLVDNSCASLSTLSQDCGRTDGGYNITLSGDNLFDLRGKLKCRFSFQKGEVYEVKGHLIDSNNLICTVPPAPYEGKVTVEVTPDGTAYSNDGLKFQFVHNLDECSVIGSAGFYLMVIGLPILLTLPAIGSWVFSLTVTPAAAILAPATNTLMAADFAKPPPTSAGGDPRFKHQVKANAYLWPGAGGATTKMGVDWGQGPAPPSAPVGHDDKDTWAPTQARAADVSGFAQARRERRARPDNLTKALSCCCCCCVKKTPNQEDHVQMEDP